MIQPPSVGTDGGGHDGGDAVERKRQAAFLRRESVGENGLRHRLQPAAARALQYAKENQRLPRLGAAPHSSELRVNNARCRAGRNASGRTGSPAIR